MLENFDAVLEYRKQLMKRMNQNKYVENFDLFTKNYGHFFTEMVSYVEQAEEKEQAAREVGEAVVTGIKKACGKSPDEKIRGSEQTDMNMFMIIYVFPSILKTEHPDAEVTAEGVLAVWNERKSSGPDIGYIDYDKVYDGFKRRLFGISLSRDK